jgi:hypothetical protein
MPARSQPPHESGIAMRSGSNPMIYVTYDQRVLQGFDEMCQNNGIDASGYCDQ